MSGATAKVIKEHISRATGYARRFEAIKALRAGATAFESYASTTAVVGRAKFELDVMLLDMLREFELVPDIKAQIRGPFKFKKGAEKTFALALSALAMHLEKLEQKAGEAANQDRLSRIAQAFEKARESLRENNLPTARRILNTVCEQNQGEPGIFSNAAKMLSEAGLHADVIPFAEKAIEINPKDTLAFSLGVESCKQAGELVKAEKLLRDALKNFGAHPKTFVSLARVLYQMGKWDQSYDAARAAYDRDPTLAEAKEVLDLTERRVMG
jgi:tetratricopeptide (TPR) repeat protein